MPYDVTMCEGGDCTLKANCLRFTGARYARQDFFGSPPFNRTTKECSSFWDDRPPYDRIASLAYELWVKDGRPAGRDMEHWYKAEIELLERIRS